jgi:hypothetical protein
LIDFFMIRKSENSVLPEYVLMNENIKFIMEG